MTTLSERPASRIAARDRGRSEPADAARATRTRLGLALFAATVYVPILLMHPGKVEADTKQYLYLDPGRLLERAATVWDPSIGMGTLSHQTLGYVFPTGPFYWVAETLLGLPAWVAQRLWLGTIIFAAGVGMRYLLRSIGVTGPGVPVAMLAYALTPYAVQYAGIYSVFLGPWAALPWWVGFTARSLRRGGWKYPALFAIVVQLVGSLNATALFLALIGPACWLLHELFVTRAVTLRDAWAFTWRTALLVTSTSLWWLAGLVVEGRYGINLLRFTETLESVATTAFPIEFLRGLGYWFFYGRDIVGAWHDGLQDFTQPAVIFAGIMIPALAMLAAGLLRWCHRVFFVAMVVIGITISVGAAPYRTPSLFGALWKSFTLHTNTGMALRNSGRAVPLVVLGIAALLGAGVSAAAAWLAERDRRILGTRIAAAVAALCLLNAAGLWGGRYYSRYLERDEQLPQYWRDAIAALDAAPNDTRVLALPGADFATYRWGDTRDPIEPGLMDRPYVAREIVPWGTEPSVNLLRALDTPLQASVFEPESLAPVARLMSVGDVLLRLDLATDRWSLVPASVLWRAFTDRPVPGLAESRIFGTEIPGRLTYPDIGDLSIRPEDEPQPPPVAVFSVRDPLPILRAKPADAPLVLAGDGHGIVSAAGAGLLDPERPVLYSAAYERDPSFLRALPRDAALVVTDSNRRRGERWSRMYNNYGYTEQTGEKPMRSNPLDQRLDLFPESSDQARTVTVMRGVRSVRATTYGDRIFGFTPAQRPSRALDGDTDTGWAVGAGFPAAGERLRIRLAEPISTDHVNLVQLLGPDQERWITHVALRFDDKAVHRVRLDDSSRETEGQEVRFPKRTFSTFEIEIERIRDTDSLVLAKKNAVGFAEVELADDFTKLPVRVEEFARMPTDLLDALGPGSLEHPLAFVISRDVMDDDAMNRQFTLPTSRTFTVSGTAVVSRAAKDDAVDRRVGLPDAASGGVTATSKHPFGRPVARASSAIDGDRTTAWNTPVGTKPSKEFMRVEVPQRLTLDHLDLAVVADGRHSIPTQLEITTDEGTKRLVEVPPLPERAADGAIAPVRVTFPAVSGTRFNFVVTRYTAVKRSSVLMPVGIAELGLPGVRRTAPPAQLPGTCIDDLVEIDGQPLPVRVTGTTSDALLQRPLALEPCDPAAPLTLAAGTHEVKIRVSPKTSSAVDVAHLVLASGPGGEGAPASAVARFAPADVGSTPRITVLERGRASATVRVDGATAPFWFVLGESNNDGWSARADGRDLGRPHIVDGYANGWPVTPAKPGAPIEISIAWEPQATIWRAMVLSVLAGIACIGIVLFGYVRRRRRDDNGLASTEAAAPELHDPRSGDGRSYRARAVWGSALASGALAAVLVRPWAGVLVAAFVYAALRRPRWRLYLRLAPATILLVLAIGIAGGQLFRRYPKRFEWPTFFDWARDPAWIAVMLLAAEAVIALVTRERTAGDEAG
jgi:arabinofuranan 3-O-arabinosyltransferase